MVTRLCACPCKEPLTGMRPDARYRTPACKTLHYRERRAQQTRVTSHSKPSGLQVSFWKTQRALEEWIEQHVVEVPSPRNLAISIVAEGLSDRQLEQLHERKRAKRAATLTVAEQREQYEREAVE